MTPQTILRWHRKLIARKYDGTGKRGLSRRALRMREVAELAIWMAQENSGWGYRRIQGGLKHLGLEVSHTTVYNILRRNGLDPSPKRGVESNWQRFIRAHMDVLGAMDFFTVEVWTLRGLVRYSVHFVMDVGTRRVLVTRIAPDWDGPIMENVARGLTDIEDGFMRKMRYAIMDNDSLDYQPG